MTHPIFRVLLVLVPVLICAGPVIAGEDAPSLGPLPPRKDDGKRTSRGKDDLKPVPLKKDPVEMAFALPRGMVLRPKEMEFATQVRNRLEPQLRAALERVANTTDKNEKLKAIKEVKQIKQQIRGAIYTILQARYVQTMKEAAKRQAAQRKAAQNRHAQQKRKHGQHKKKGKRKKRR